MRSIRVWVAILAVLTIVAMTAVPAAASKCGQYPTFIEPLLCRL